MKGKRRGIICFILSVMLTITLIPEFSFGTEAASSGQITGFVPLETDSYYYEGDPSEEDITAKLPGTLDVYLDGSSSPTAISVKWQSVEDFDETDFYFYSMKPVWDSNYTLSPELSSILDVPWVTIYKQEPLSDEAEPMLTEDELDPIYVNDAEVEQENGYVEVETPTEPKTQEPAETKPATDVTEVEENENDEPEDSNNTALTILKLFCDETYAATKSNTDIIYEYLTGTMGLNRAAACGVMTNINAESAMSPINLENTYNSLYGLTDSEYTKRVDAGKGAYKTKSGASRNFKTDYCGYGICQWTSLSRRKNLLAKALAKGVSVGDINMQLEFLKEELTGSYSSVMNTLKSVPDNAQGAYMAAFVFCMNFEVPANTLNTSASRAKTCISSGGYWAKYSGSAASTSSTSFLALTGFAYPVTLKAGKGMTAKGYAISNYNITKVTATIKDANNVTKYSASATPNKTVYSLYSFDDKLLFSKLATGKYTYTITAKDKSGKAVKTFTVSSSASSNETAIGFCMGTESAPATTPSTQPTTEQTKPESTLDIYSFNYPKTLKKGKSFSIKGTVKSNYKLRKVTVKVVTKSGTKKLSASKSLTGSAKSYSIKKLDSKIKFGKLKKGTYYYKVIAKDTQVTRTLVKKKFTVK